VEWIALVSPVLESEAGGAGGGHGGKQEGQGLPVGAPGKIKPSESEKNERQTQGESGRKGADRGKGDPQNEGGRQEEEREGTGS
jgi:hypothetical protein